SSVDGGLIHARRSRLVAVPFLLALAACPGSKSRPHGRDAGHADAGEPAKDAGSAPPALKQGVRYQGQGTEAGMWASGVTSGGPRPSIEATSQLELTTNIGLQNYRVRLFDEAERAMASDDQMEEPGDSVKYRIQLPAPLKAGHKYALVV